MPDAPDDPTAQQRAVAAKAALARAQADLAKAEAELAAAKNPDPETVKAKEATAKIDAIKSTVDAQKALAESQAAAQAATIKAKFGSLSALSGITPGTVTLADGAAKAEATLLTAGVYRDIAAAIAKDVAAKVGDNTVILLSGVELPSVANHQHFIVRLKALSVVLANARRRASEIAAFGDKLARASPTAGGASTLESKMVPSLLPAPLTVAGAALDAASKIASYFQTDYTVGGLTVEHDNEQLLAALAGESRLGDKRIVPKFKAAASAQQDAIKADIDNLGARVAAVEQEIVDLQQRAAKAEADAKATDAKATSDMARKAALEAAAAFYKQGVADLPDVGKEFRDFMAFLETTDATGKPFIVKVLQEKSLYDLLTSTPTCCVLLVDVRAAVGASYSQKSIWTFFAGLPLFAMGGAVVTYAMVDPKTGRVLASGLKATHSGYWKVREVALLSRLRPSF